jgi:hypothetical protein
MTNKRIIPVAALGLLAAAAFAAPAAQADSSKPCGLRTSTQAFAAWSDTADYWLMKGGDFESPSSFWTFAGGATIAYGNEPWKVFSGGNKSSLLLPSTAASASSSATCLQVGEEAGRMFYLSPGVAGSYLHVQVDVTTTAGAPLFSLGGNIPGSTAGWQVSPIFRIPNLFTTATSVNIKVTMQPAGVSAPWRVDDVSVDPFRGS